MHYNIFEHKRLSSLCVCVCCSRNPECMCTTTENIASHIANKKTIQFRSLLLSFHKHKRHVRYTCNACSNSYVIAVCVCVCSFGARIFSELQMNEKKIQTTTITNDDGKKNYPQNFDGRNLLHESSPANEHTINGRGVARHSKPEPEIVLKCHKFPIIFDKF